MRVRFFSLTFRLPFKNSEMFGAGMPVATASLMTPNDRMCGSSWSRSEAMLRRYRSR